MEINGVSYDVVALRKESVDRNVLLMALNLLLRRSLSARRAWIEIVCASPFSIFWMSLSARRAWIEIDYNAQ